MYMHMYVESSRQSEWRRCSGPHVWEDLMLLHSPHHVCPGGTCSRQRRVGGANIPPTKYTRYARNTTPDLLFLGSGFLFHRDRRTRRCSPFCCRSPRRCCCRHRHRRSRAARCSAVLLPQPSLPLLRWLWTPSLSHLCPPRLWQMPSRICHQRRSKPTCSTCLSFISRDTYQKADNDVEGPETMIEILQ